MTKLEDTNALAALRDKLKKVRNSYTHTITMCAGTACQACGCLPVAKAMKEELAKHELLDQVHFFTSGCHGFCEQGPMIIIEPENIFYCHVTPDDVKDIVASTLKGSEVVERLFYTDPVSGERIEKEKDIPFYSAQDRILLADNPRISPADIEAYIANGGYSALEKVLSGMSADEVVEEVKASCLRGRGGGGYPTGKKWEQCKAVSCQERYVICNADEGDPGAYMDRSLLEGNPHSVLEGMLIGAYAIGSGQGFVYV